MAEEPGNTATKLGTAPSGKANAGETRSLFQPPQGGGRTVQEQGLAGYRIAAKLVDLAVLRVFGITLFFVFFNSNEAEPLGSEESWQAAIRSILALWVLGVWLGAIDIIYFFSFEYFSQATPGKKLFKLKVIDYVKGRPGASQILGRSIVSALFTHFLLWPIELIAMLLDRREMRIADHAAGTKVIRVRKARAGAAHAGEHDKVA